MQVHFFIICMLLTGCHERTHAQEQVRVTTHATSSSDTAEQALAKILLQGIGLSAQTLAGTLTAEQQDLLLCAIWEHLFDPEDSKPYHTIRAVFKEYCYSFETVYPEIDALFSCKDIGSWHQIIKNILRAYDNVIDNQLPPHTHAACKKNRALFRRKFPWDQRRHITKITKKFCIT